MISVIICTRNPRRDYLDRVISALRAQTLGADHWDLLVVDNGSDTPLLPNGLIDWHPRGRIVREEMAGITFARLRGIAETSGDLLLFVDDDNVLAADYVEEVLRIVAKYPALGTFGAGIIAPGLEGVAPRLPKRVRQHLTLRRHLWAIQSHKLSPRHCPSGAGMVVRREVAELYLKKWREGRLLLATLMKTIGLSLSGPGANDFDLGYQAGALRMKMGVFPSLRLTHLLEPRRMEAEYLLELIRNNARAMALLAFVYNDGRLPRARLPARDALLRMVAPVMGCQRWYRVQHAWWTGEIGAHDLLHEYREALERLQRGPTGDV